ncbi:MAG: hypothetical protein J7K40_12155 [candidate division Zixibacteria bacterium]|nr:hypothetical protein [candidate division Zixibacteria bacterium]
MYGNIQSFDVCVSDLPDGFVANDIVDAVAEFVGDDVLVLSVYPNRLKLRLPQQCAMHVVKMVIEMHLNKENTGERQSVSVTRI